MAEDTGVLVTEATTKVKPKIQRFMQIVNLPNIAIKSIVDARAKELGINTGRYLLELAAAELNFEIPKTLRTRTPKYASVEDKNAARDLATKTRKDRMVLAMALLTRLQAGETLGPDELMTLTGVGTAIA